LLLAHDPLKVCVVNPLPWLCIIMSLNMLIQIEVMFRYFSISWQLKTFSKHIDLNLWPSGILPKSYLPPWNWQFLKINKKCAKLPYWVLLLCWKNEVEVKFVWQISFFPANGASLGNKWYFGIDTIQFYLIRKPDCKIFNPAKCTLFVIKLTN
jgi:hypothetical protein